jgi:DNA-binding transcriptional LysR family regulator
LSPTTRKVDIAVTSSPPESSRLVIERLTDYELGLYASREYLEKRGAPQTREDLKRHDFVACVDDLIYSEQLRFLDAFEPDLPRRLKCSSMKVQITLAVSGGGIGAFPHYLVESRTDLKPVLPELVVTRTYWMATHIELHEIARVRVVHDWIYALAAEHRLQLTPMRVPSSPPAARH